MQEELKAKRVEFAEKELARLDISRHDQVWEANSDNAISCLIYMPGTDKQKMGWFTVSFEVDKDSYKTIEYHEVNQ